MSETKWTPGPWTLHSKAQMSVMGARGYAVASCGGHADNTRDCDELLAEQSANARLIAAAPTMAGALEIVRAEILKMREDVRVGGCSGVTAIAVIDAALAKARGE